MTENYQLTQICLIPDPFQVLTAINPVNNNLYVVDGKNHRIQIFDANGTFISKFGTQWNCTWPVNKSNGPSYF